MSNFNLDMRIAHIRERTHTWGTAWSDKAYKELISDVLAEVVPERLPLSKDEPNSDWFYGRGNNGAIDDMEDKIKELGL